MRQQLVDSKSAIAIIIALRKRDFEILLRSRLECILELAVCLLRAARLQNPVKLLSILFPTCAPIEQRGKTRFSSETFLRRGGTRASETSRRHGCFWKLARNHDRVVESSRKRRNGASARENTQTSESVR